MNVRDNCGDDLCPVEVEELLWSEHQEFKANYPEGFDLILAADVIYEEEAVEPLLSTAHALLSEEESTFILSFAKRNVSIDKVLARADALDFHVASDKTFTCSNPGEEIYVLKRKS